MRDLKKLEMWRGEDEDFYTRLLADNIDIARGVGYEDLAEEYQGLCKEEGLAV